MGLWPHAKLRDVLMEGVIGGAAYPVLTSRGALWELGPGGLVR